MWDLPRPGLEPVSPASAGRSSTTAPPGKPHLLSILINLPFLDISPKWDHIICGPLVFCIWLLTIFWVECLSCLYFQQGQSLFLLQILIWASSLWGFPRWVYPPPSLESVTPPSEELVACTYSNHSVCVGRQTCQSHLGSSLKSRTRFPLFLPPCTTLHGIESFLKHLLCIESQKITDNKFPPLRPGQRCEDSEQSLL